MNRFWSSGSCLGAALLLAVFTSASAPLAAAQDPTPRAHKSVYGKLESFDKDYVIMRSDDGKRLAWRFEAAVIAEAAQFEPGHPLIVIYRQTRPNEKTVTAIAFPGAAETPIYRNMTGSRIVFRSGPMVDGACGKIATEPVKESTIPALGQAEISDACWCCALAGETCTPANKSGLGQAFLVKCFK